MIATLNRGNVTLNLVQARWWGCSRANVHHHAAVPRSRPACGNTACAPAAFELWRPWAAVGCSFGHRCLLGVLGRFLAHHPSPSASSQRNGCEMTHAAACLREQDYEAPDWQTMQRSPGAGANPEFARKPSSPLGQFQARVEMNEPAKGPLPQPLGVNLKILWRTDFGV